MSERQTEPPIAGQIHVDTGNPSACIGSESAVELESQLGTAHAEIARLEAALRQVATMKTIIGARRVVADALNEKER